MNELVFVTQKGNLATDSLIVAEVFGKRHDHVLRDIKNQMSKLEEANEQKFNETNFGGVSYIDKKGETRPKYILSEDAFTLVTMSYNTVEAMKFKVKYINEFKRMKEYIKNQQAPVLSPMEQIAQALTIADNIIKEQALQLEEQKPKVEFANSVCDSNDLILIGDLAKLLTQNGYKIGQNNLFKKLREEGYLHKNSKRPTQRSMNMGLFRIVEHKPKDGFSMEPTTKVTGKGQEYFINKFLKELNEEK